MYLTNEQAQRIAALSLDALVGVKLDQDGTDAMDIGPTWVEWARIDQPTNLRECAVVYPDGSWMMDSQRLV